MKILIDYTEVDFNSVVAYITANGNDPDRYLRSRLPHPLNKFKEVKLDYKEPKRRYKKRKKE